MDQITHTLKEDIVEQLLENIPILLCNLEKIFPPTFFDVIEHLAVHLPYETLLRGHVHYKWMYQSVWAGYEIFERKTKKPYQS